MGYAIDEWQVAWNEQAKASSAGSAVEVGKSAGDWTDGYNNAQGPEGRTLEEKVAHLFITFHTLVVRDRVDPLKAHREFLKIDEYRRRIDSEIEGADDGSADL
jgi:hypothetical protein